MCNAPLGHHSHEMTILCYFLTHQIVFVRHIKISFSITVATVGVAWFLDLFTIWQKNQPTNSNFGEDVQVSYVSKKDEREEFEKKLPNEEIVQCYCC